MVKDREAQLFEHLERNREATQGYQFHWVVENRIPTSWGEVPFKPLIAINWEDGQNEEHEGPALYNTHDPMTWSSVSNRTECAQVVASVIVFDANNKITDVVKAEPGKCIINARWTVQPKAHAEKRKGRGAAKFTELFELKFEAGPTKVGNG
jgi:hypothetical protein